MPCAVDFEQPGSGPLSWISHPTSLLKNSRKAFELGFQIFRGALVCVGSGIWGSGRWAMSMSRWGAERQWEMFVPVAELAAGPTHLFDERLNQVLRERVSLMRGWSRCVRTFMQRGGDRRLLRGFIFGCCLWGTSRTSSRHAGLRGGVGTACRCVRS